MRQQGRRTALVNFRMNGQISGHCRQRDGNRFTTQDLTDSNLPLIYVRTLGGSPRVLALKYP